MSCTVHRLAHLLAIPLAIGYVVLFLFNNLERQGRFSPDSMNYVDVARHIVTGLGITQSTINLPYFSVDEDTPVPLTIQGPLYPFTIAVLLVFGCQAPTAALIISSLGYFAILALAYTLMLVLYDRHVALFCSALLLIYHPLTLYARFALSDTLRGVFLLAGLLILVRDAKETRVTWRSVMAGGVFGLGFVTSYALAPTFALGVIWLIATSVKRGDRLGGLTLRIILFVIGFMIPVAPVLARNLILTGKFTGSSTLPITLAPTESLYRIISVFSASYLSEVVPGRVQQVLLGTVFLASSVILLLRRNLLVSLRGVFVSHNRSILSLWLFIYIGFLVYGRSRTFFDLDRRTLLPAGITFVMLGAGLAGAVAGRCVKYLELAALLIFCVGLLREVRIARGPASSDFEQRVARSERLQWVAEQTSARDLIIGIDTYDIPFYFRRDSVLCFLPLPYGENPEYAKVMVWVSRKRALYERVFFVIPAYAHSPDEWRRQYGSFIADLVSGNLQPYPAIRAHLRLEDAYIFEFW